MKPAENTPLSWSEDRLQQEVVMWFRNKYPRFRGCLYSIPNGGGRSGFEGKILKSTGVHAGVFDMCLDMYGKSYKIELKRPNGSNNLSDKQRAWMVLMQSHRFECTVWNDLPSLKAYIERIIDDVV